MADTFIIRETVLKERKARSVVLFNDNIAPKQITNTIWVDTAGYDAVAISVVTESEELNLAEFSIEWSRDKSEVCAVNLCYGNYAGTFKHRSRALKTRERYVRVALESNSDDLTLVKVSAYLKT